MALVNCRECNKEISAQAKTCPNCGAKNGKSLLGKLLKVFLGLILLSALMSALSRNTNVSPPTSSSATAAPSEIPASKRPLAKKAEVEARRLLSGFKKSVDKMDGITWYSSHPQANSITNRIEAYLGEKEGAYWLRMKIMYTGENWLFIKGFKFLVDDHSIEFDAGNVSRDHSSGTVWEWIDTQVTKDKFSLLKAIADSKKAEIRYVGQQYKKDRRISGVDRNSIRRILEAYEELGGAVE